MKILLLAPEPFFQNRGTPIAVRLLAQTLGKLGHEVHLLTYAEGENISLDNVTIHRIPSLHGLLGAIRPGFSLKKLFSDAMMAAESFWLRKKNQFDYVHAVEESVFIAMLLAAVFHTPYIYDLDSWMSDQLIAGLVFLRPFRAVFEYFERLAVRRSSGVVPVCRALEDKIRSFDRTKLLVRLEDISLLAENTGSLELLREKYGCQGRLVMYVGNLERYQGIALLLEAFSLADPDALACSLVVIGGTAKDIEQHKEIARRLGIAGQVFFIGPRPAADLGMYLSQADVLVSPRTEGENTPMKLYSYMDSGLPILATKIASHTQVLDEETAFLAAPEPAAMAAELKRILADSGEARRRAGRAKEKASAEYSQAAYESKLSRFYDELARLRHLPAARQ